MKILLSLTFFVVVLLFGCKKKNTEYLEINSSGKELSERYCASCHQYPEPSLLDKKTWKNFVLPRMGYMYGIYDSTLNRKQLIEKNEGGLLVDKSNIFPKERRLDSTTWNAILNYYISNAPDSLLIPNQPKISKQLAQFKVVVPNQKVKIPSTTLAQFSEDGFIYLGDALTKSFSVFDKKFNLETTATIPEGLVSLNEGIDAYNLTVMGTFAPTDAPKGAIISFPKNKNTAPKVLVDQLQRPVHASYGDLDGDGDTDIVVCEFGKWTGALSIFLKEQSSYQKKVLMPVPGAIKAYLHDMNDDGFKDVVALFAQGNEGVDIFYNDGKANFSRKRILQFSPSMGTSYFKLIDYNKDGFLDIILTAGDNADYIPVMKPWHGVYVFVNKGNDTFREEVFLHLNGAYNAVANDFDLDGDIDIAAISFFPDWLKTPEESFVYFENSNGYHTRNTFKGVNNGRWIVMDAKDYDSDGDLDLILGSLAFEVVPKLGYIKKWMQKGIPFVILENREH